MGIRGKMIKVKVSHLKDFVKLRASKEVELILILLAGFSAIGLRRGGRFNGGPKSPKQGYIGKGNVLCAVGTIMDTLESVDEEAVDVLHVDNGT
ncbi:hypothetical protein ACFX1S_040662 [Malus domestica]